MKQGGEQHTINEGDYPMHTPEERDPALACLNLANTINADTSSIVERAEAFFAFVTGQTPRDQINAALDRAGVK